MLLGNANGTFQPAQTSATGASPVSVAVGDFNGDGKLDLATANGRYDVSVLLGNGDGTFQAPSQPRHRFEPRVRGRGRLQRRRQARPGRDVERLHPGSTARLVGTTVFPGYWYPLRAQANVLLGQRRRHASPAPNTHLRSATARHAAAGGRPQRRRLRRLRDRSTMDYGYVSVLLGDSSGYLQGPVDFVDRLLFPRPWPRET